MKLFGVWVFVFGFAIVARGATNFFELDLPRFNAAAAQEIRLERINQELLSAAVLRETNVRRRAARLTELRHEPKASEAAKIQSEIMRTRGAISHDNPESPQYRTLEKRVKAAGLEYRLIAENVATAFALQYQSGKPYYPERKEGGTVFRYRPGGPAIERHTYASFAKALVNAWMGSKGHRENILREEARFLGVSCLPAKSKQNEIPTFYCTQVFFTPLKD